MDISKRDVKELIDNCLSVLLSNDEIVFTGKTKLNSIVKDYYLKTIKNPIIMLNKEIYSMDEPVSFTGTGDFLFVEDVTKNEKEQNILIPGEKDYSFSGSANFETDNNGIVASIKDNILTIHCVHS